MRPEDLVQSHVVRVTLNRKTGLKKARAAFECAYIEQMLRFNEGSVAATAKAIGMDRTALHRKMRTLGLKAR
jgi:DNA-binding NtrC family response regulator